MKKIDKVYAYKHDGSFHRVNKDVRSIKETKDYYIILNKKNNYVYEKKNYKWKTKEKAVIYFSKNHWFNIMLMYKKKRMVYYCNIATPIMYEHGSLKYIDYDLDVKYFVDTKDRILLDKNEYNYNKKKYGYSKKIQRKIDNEIKILNEWIDYQIGPFSKEFREKYKDVGE